MLNIAKNYASNLFKITSSSSLKVSAQGTALYEDTYTPDTREYW